MTTVGSPIGALTHVAVDGVLTGLYMQDQRHAGPTDVGNHDPGAFGAVAVQLAAYFGGELTRFELPLDLTGTPFQGQVWAGCVRDPIRPDRHLRELAARIGRPGTCRTVGLANGRNPISIMGPCHRVVGAGERLTGYGGGLSRKQQLLDLERLTCRKGPG